MLFRLAYLGVTNTLALLRLLPISDRDKDAEILALRHQVMVLERQLHDDRLRFSRADRAWLAALLHPLPHAVLSRLRLLVRPETVLRWHRDLIVRRHARISRPHEAGRPRTGRSIRRLVLRLASQNSTWGYQAVRSCRHRARHPPDSDPRCHRASDRQLGDPDRPESGHGPQDTGSQAKYLIRDRDGKYPALFDQVLDDAGIDVVLSGVRIPRMNSIMERRIQACRLELLDRTLIFNPAHLLHALQQSILRSTSLLVILGAPRRT